MKIRASWRLLFLAVLVTGTNLFAKLRRLVSRPADRSALATFHRLARLLVRTLGVRVERSGRLPDGLCVIVANHRSYVDIPLVMAEMPSIFLAKSEIAGWPLFGPAARLCGTVFVERDDRASRARALDSLGRLLDRGERIVVFPEGTTSTGPGCLPFRPGVFRLAAERGLPVVPVAIAYGDVRDAWVDDDSFIGHFLDRFGERRMRVVVAIGPELRATDGLVLKQAAERWIADRLAPYDRTNDVAPEAEPSLGAPLASATFS